MSLCVEFCFTMFSYVLQVNFPSIMNDHLKTLSVTCDRERIWTVEDADYFPRKRMVFVPTMMTGELVHV